MLVLLQLLLVATVQGTTLNEQIYKTVDYGNILCFRMNNFNSQTGCQTSRDGDHGVLYPFQSESEIEAAIDDLDVDIIAVIPADLFTNRSATLLKKYRATKGIFIISGDPVDSFSPEKSCPGNGFNYKESIAEDSPPKTCESNKYWNPTGNWLSYFDFPFGIFIVTNETEAGIINTNAFSNIDDEKNLKPFPLWGGAVRAFMNSALDTETCMRRGICDPIGGLNLHVNFLPRSTGRKRPIVLLITKGDATAFFKSLSYGGRDSGTSIAVLLGVIKALSKVRDNDKNNDFNSTLTADFMISFLQAESFDYSGSQRMAYDLTNHRFGKKAYNISITDVSCIIELGPLSSSNQLYLHSAQSDNEYVKILRALFKKYSGPGKDFEFNEIDTLPPSSINSFLREYDSVPSILLTDGETQLTSSVYGSRYDVLENSPLLSQRLTNLVKVITNVAVQYASGTESEEAQVDESLMSNILDCFLVNQNCSLLRSTLNNTNIFDKRLSRYSSIGHSSSNNTIYLTYLASDFSRKTLDLPEAQCNSSYIEGGWTPWIRDGTCYGIAVNLTSAQSPAFLLKDHKSTKYSTWTESRWSPNFSVRMFLVASKNENVIIFVCGLLYFIVFSLLICQCHRQSDKVFTNFQ